MQTSDTIARLYHYLVQIILLEKNVEKFYTIYKGYFYGKNITSQKFQKGL